MSARWFRVYDDLVHDPKVQRLPDRLFKALINLWCLASGNDGALPSVDDIAFELRLKPEKAYQVLADLRFAGLLDDDDDGSGIVRPHNWQIRQFKSDVTDPTAAERMQRHRNRKRNDTVTETVTSRSPETETETDTEAETERSSPSLRSGEPRARKPRKVSSQLPADWRPSNASRERARTLGFSETKIDETAEDLRVWAVGKGEPRADWDATFDGFVRRDAKQNRQGSGPGPPRRERVVNGYASLALEMMEEDRAAADRDQRGNDAGPRPANERDHPNARVLDAERSDEAGGTYALPLGD